MSGDEWSAISRHCGALVTVFADALTSGRDPLEDPVVCSLVDQVDQFPNPSQVILCLASMNAVALRRLSDLAATQGVPTLPIERLRRQMRAENRQGAILRDCALALIDGIVAGEPDRERNAELLRALTLRWGVSAVSEMALIHAWVLEAYRKHDPTATTASPLAEWELAVELILFEGRELKDG